MSVKVVQLVWEAELEPVPKYVLVCLADHANPEGVCWPSIPRIAKRTGLGHRTVQRAIKELELAGQITRTEMPGKGYTYRVHPCRSDAPRGVGEGCLSDASAMPQRHARGAAAAPEGGRSDTRTVKNRQNRKEPPAPRARDRRPNSKSAGARPLSADWQPDLTDPELLGIITGWPRDRFARELAQFQDHAAANARRLVDWQAGIRSWLRNARDPDAPGGERDGLFRASQEWARDGRRWQAFPEDGE